MRASPTRAARRLGSVASPALLALAVLVGACADGGTGEGAGSATTAPAAAASTPGGDGASSASTSSSSAVPSVDCPAPTGQLAAFGSDVVVVVAPDGSRVERCVAVADRGDLRSRGLMGVNDLGPVEGMVFAYAGVSAGGYWMRDTPMPLSIAWIGVDGRVVATADMEPCLDRGSSCPSYEPGIEYRWAIEVPQGELAGFGLVDGATLDVASLPVGLD